MCLLVRRSAGVVLEMVNAVTADRGIGLRLTVGFLTGSSESVSVSVCTDEISVLFDVRRTEPDGWPRVVLR